MSNTYYQDELRYLREVGPEFAKVNPEIARFLGDRGSDPDVERLLEGVAFLCGRIRQKLDDELPELTASLMALLWPHYLRPIPSMTILELLPDIEAMQAPLVVPAGAEFASVAIDGTSCRYRCAAAVKLRPWALEDARLETAAGQPARLVLRLRTSSKGELGKLELDAVRLHLAGDPRTAFTLYLLLAGHVDFITVSDGVSGAQRRETRLESAKLAATGLDRAEAILPYPARSFPGYRLFQEYFAFKERFLFVELSGLERAARELGLGQNVEIAFTFNRRLDSYPLVSRDNLRLHCAPIINLFPHSADPIRVQHDRTQYLVMPAKSGVADRRHVEVYSIDQVVGLVHTGTLKSRVYEPFYSFQHIAMADTGEAIYYQSHLTNNMLGSDPRLGTDTYLSFVSSGMNSGLPPDETISAELTCTNRHLPGSLRAGDVCQPTDSSPSGIKFRNLSKPTATISPPLGKALHWRLISHLSLNYVSLTDAEHFKELLRVYDFQSEQDAQRALAQQRLLDGILSMRSSFRERMIRGTPVRGTLVEVELNEDHFTAEGDAYLFATILDRFVSLYSTINAYTELNVRFFKSGQRYAFPPRWGEQLTPASERGVETQYG